MLIPLFRHRIFRRRRFRLLRHVLSQSGLSVCPSVCMCIVCQLVHSANAFRRNKMPLGRDTSVAPNNVVLDGPWSLWEVEILGWESPVCSHIAILMYTVFV